MYNHQPKDYICPLCVAIKGEENEHTWYAKAIFFIKMI